MPNTTMATTATPSTLAIQFSASKNASADQRARKANSSVRAANISRQFYFSLCISPVLGRHRAHKINRDGRPRYASQGAHRAYTMTGRKRRDAKEIVGRGYTSGLLDGHLMLPIV